MHPSGAPLTAAVSQSAESLAVETLSLDGPSKLHPEVPFDGELLHRQELVAAIGAMVDRGAASTEVASAIAWLVEQAGEDGIDLRGRRIAMLGAGAELAPTRMWLEGGADVLWIDIADPPDELLAADDLAGTLRWVPGGVDLLAEPARVRATVEQFAGDDRIDLGLYAYAGGRAREWRLTAAMNAIVDALPTGSVQGVAMLLSPTTCGVVTDAELTAEADRRANARRWLRVLERLRLLGRGAGHVTVGAKSANRGVVSIQGGSYQGAQYVGKLLAAEVWAAADPAINVSANTAGVSLTRVAPAPGVRHRLRRCRGDERRDVRATGRPLRSTGCSPCAIGSIRKPPAGRATTSSPPASTGASTSRPTRSIRRSGWLRVSAC